VSTARHIWAYDVRPRSSRRDRGVNDAAETARRLTCDVRSASSRVQRAQVQRVQSERAVSVARLRMWPTTEMRRDAEERLAMSTARRASA